MLANMYDRCWFQRSPASINSKEDEDKSKKTEELQSREFDLHTCDGLLEGLSHYYDYAAYVKKNTSEQLKMLVKRYSIAQLKHVIILSSVATCSLVGPNFHCITSKARPGKKLKDIIVPVIEGTNPFGQFASDKKS